MANTSEDEYVCLSFNSYSSDQSWKIALKSAAETTTEYNDDEDFEFSMVRDDKDFSADRFGNIGSIFPVFNRDHFDGEKKPLEKGIDVPLVKLLFGDRNINSGSCSSSEADEIENIPEGSYCVWRPKGADQPSPSRCKKSRSAGSSSKRWKFRDLLRRSNSEGKDSFVFLTPKNREEKIAVEVPIKGKEKGVRRSAHEEMYVRNRAIKAGEKKKSYLPYRQDLVGFFVNVNVFSKTSPQF